MTRTRSGAPTDPPICVPVSLPVEDQLVAAERAMALNPANRPNTEGLADYLPAIVTALVGDTSPLRPEHLAVTRYWGADGVTLTVGFMEQTATDLRDRILSHLNAWSEFCNCRFAWVGKLADAQVRISRGRGGYWSYMGPDILSIRKNEPTMNLEAFTMRTPEAECRRVITHEAGHTLGFPHEHVRREIVARIDPEKAVAYFGRTQGWSAAMTRQQVLTPLEESSVLGTEHADENSIMCYQLPGQIMKDGKPVLGGDDIDAEDKAFAAKVYPLSTGGPIPPGNTVRVEATYADGGECVTEYKNVTKLSIPGYEVKKKA